MRRVRSSCAQKRERSQLSPMKRASERRSTQSERGIQSDAKSETGRFRRVLWRNATLPRSRNSAVLKKPLCVCAMRLSQIETDRRDDVIHQTETKAHILCP
jgi:hypothetical protein